MAWVLELLTLRQRHRHRRRGMRRRPSNDAGDGCGPTCFFEECGNGIIDPGEECDDGNNADGDGCQGNCFSRWEACPRRGQADRLATGGQTTTSAFSAWRSRRHRRDVGAMARSTSSCTTGAWSEHAGSAYVFVRSGKALWSEQAKLISASDAAAGDRNSAPAVALSGDTAVVAASASDGGPHGRGLAGSAYVFVRSGTSWSEQAKLTASDAAAGRLFGYSVALSGDTAVVGAITGDDHAGGTDAGSAYVFVRSGTSWSEQAKLTASDAATVRRLRRVRGALGRHRRGGGFYPTTTRAARMPARPTSSCAAGRAGPSRPS